MEQVWYDETITGRVGAQQFLVADLPARMRVTEFILWCAMGYGERPDHAEVVEIYLGRCAVRDLSCYMEINRRWLLEYLQVQGRMPRPGQLLIGPYVAKREEKPEASEDEQLISVMKPAVYAGVCRQPGEVFPLYGRNTAQADKDFQRIAGYASCHQWLPDGWRRRASRAPH